MLTSITILYLLTAGFKASLSLLLPYVAKEIHLNLSQVGFLSSLTSALGIVIALPSVHIANKFGGLKVLIFPFLFLTVAFLGVGLAFNFPVLLIFYFLAGIGFGIFLPIALAIMAKLSDKNARGRTVANFSAGADVGRLVLGGGVGFLAGFIGWRSTAFLYATLALAAFIVMYFKYLHKKVSIKEDDKDSPDPATVKHYLKNIPYLLSNLAGSLDVLAGTALFIFLPF